MPGDDSSVLLAEDGDADSIEAAPHPGGQRAAQGVNKRAPTHTDASVGRLIRRSRLAQGMPLAELSSKVGVSQPQLYRYESGLTRVAASRLIAIASALGVSVEALTSNADHPPKPRGGGAEVELLLRAFSNITQPERRNALLALARSMADTDVPA